MKCFLVIILTATKIILFDFQTLNKYFCVYVYIVLISVVCLPKQFKQKVMSNNTHAEIEILNENLVIIKEFPTDENASNFINLEQKESTIYDAAIVYEF